ncbi:MAG: hypothetical protein IMZ64_05020 [Bacteroidetes bacterium]|nr:hypothetical protein [Bacteroidota bacterium]
MLKDLTGGGKKYDMTQSPQWQQSLQQLQSLSGYYKDLMSPNSQAYQNFAAPEMQNFQQQIVPGVAERFAGMGAGSQSSSAFNQTMAQEGGNLQMRLAALRSGLQMQGAQGMEGLSQTQANMGMAPYQMMMQRAQLALGTSPFGYQQKPESSASRFGGAFSAGLGGAIPGAITGFMTGGPPGALIGAGTGFAAGAANQWVGR